MFTHTFYFRENIKLTIDVMEQWAFTLFRRHFSSSTLFATKSLLLGSAPSTAASTSYTTPPLANVEEHKPKDGWFRLPPFDMCPASSVVGKMMAMPSEEKEKVPIPQAATVMKWIRRCCPGVPVTLLHKLFRLRKIRKQQCASLTTDRSQSSQCRESLSFGRVSANDEINHGDVILLPNSVRQHPPPSDKVDYCCSSDEIDYIRSLEIYKDSAIIVLNKPHGLPVQGGIGIKLSIDVLAATSLRYDYKESPRLVHRLDKDSSGILVLGRTQTSAAILHSIFREKTFEASKMNKNQRFLQRKYLALVIGKPRYSKGKISEPLKMVVKNGKYERIAISSLDSPASQVALTEYKVIGSHQHGYTWLELCPLTGRKHQLRVHCAEVLGTPIVGDYKYGWNAHKRWVSVLPNLSPDIIDNNCFSTSKSLPFGLNLVGGDILDERPLLHLHCRQMKLPNISEIIQSLQSTNDDQKQDFSKIEHLDLIAPLPCHMQRSWDISNQSSRTV